MSKGKFLTKISFLMYAIVVMILFTGCIGEGVGRSGGESGTEETAPEASSTPSSFDFLAEANSLSAKNLKTTLKVAVKDAFGLTVDNVQVKFSLVNANDSKVLRLGNLSTGSDVIVLSQNGEASVDVSAKASGLPSQEVSLKAEIIGFGKIPSKTIKIFVKEIPLTFTVQDLPKILFNKGALEFVSIQVRDPDGNSVNGVDVEIVPVADSPLKFYDIQTALQNGQPSKNQTLKYVTEGDGIISFNLWAKANSGSRPVTTHFNIRVGSSSNRATPSEDVKIYFVNLSNIGSLDSLKANGFDTRTLSVKLEGEMDAENIYIRWKTTLGNIVGKGTTLSKKLPYSDFSSGVSSATLNVANESGVATITASLINTLADDNDSDAVIAEISYDLTLKEVKPASISIVANRSFLVAGGGEVFSLTGQVLDKDGVGINNTNVAIEVAGEVPLELVKSVKTTTIAENRGAYKFNASAFNLSGQWTITVTAGGLTNSISIEQLSDNPSSILVNEGKEVESIFVKGTGNKENTSVTFKVLDRFGNPISESLGVKLLISIASGPGGGEQVDPSVPTETVNGVVSANIRAGNRSGTVRVHAEVENNPTISADTNIAIAKGPLDASSINLKPHYSNVAGRYIVFLEDKITASLADSSGDAVPDGQSVTFVTKGTGNFFKNGVSTTSLGFASDTLVTATNPDPFFGFSVLTAEANGGEDVYATAMAFLGGSAITFAGTKGGGVKKTNSTEKGSVNWIDSNGDFPWLGQSIYDLQIPDNTTSVFAATNSGLFKSSNLGTTWTSIRSGQNSNKPGFVLNSLNTSTITSIAFANEYLNNTSGSDPEATARNPNDVDVLVGTNGEGVWYNTSRGESFSIIDADGVLTDGSGYSSASVIDGAFLKLFDIGKASKLYYFTSATRTGFLNVSDPNNVATYKWVVVVPVGATLPTAIEFKAKSKSVNSHLFPNLAFNDKNTNGVYDDGEEIVATGYVDSVFRGGWVQSGTLGTGSFVKRLASQKANSINYVIAATSEGVIASVGTSSVGSVWSNIGVNGNGIFMKKAHINDIYLKSDLTLYAATGEYGVYKFTGLNSIAKTPATVTSGWSKLGSPSGSDTVLSNRTGVVVGHDDLPLNVLTATDRLYYKDVDNNGKFNGLDQIVYIPAGGTLPTVSVFPQGQAVDVNATYYPVETATKFLRYVDLNKNGVFDYASDILVLDWNDNFIFDESKDDYQSFNAVIEHSFGATAYIFAASTNGGVFYAPVNNTSSWKQLDIRDTNVSAKRFYSNNGNLYICTSKSAEIIEITGFKASTGISSDVSEIDVRNINKGANNAGNIDTKIRGTATIVSTGAITPRISFWPSYNQYVQNLPGSSTTLMTDPTTEEGQMYFYSKVTLEDSNGNPPVAGTKIEVEIKEVEVDVDKTGASSDVEREFIRVTYNYTYGDIESRGPGITQYLDSMACTNITRDPASSPPGIAYNDRLEFKIKVTAPATQNVAPGVNGDGLATVVYTVPRVLFTPLGGGTLIRQ